MIRYERDFARPGRSLAVGTRGMAATSHPQATLGAVDVLRAGGSAADAAIAAVALQSVIDPHMTGIGGDCFVMVSPASGRPTSLNGSGKAPSALTLGHLRDLGRSTIPDDSVHAVTVPGAVDAWCRLHAEHGRLELARVLAPAIEAAENGFLVTPLVAYDWRRHAGRLARHAPAAAQFLPGGSAPRVGDRIANPALARTLRRIAAEGRDAFYEGEVAEDIVATLRALGGHHEEGDLASHASLVTQPLSVPYRGYDLFECPPNGQGLAALLIARILDGFDLSDAAFGDADRIHLLAEATKCAYRQRDLLIGDPAHMAADVGDILSDRSVERIRARISMDRTSEPVDWDGPLHRDTVYVTVVDEARNAVSLINSIFHAFGSGIYAAGSGVLLQSRGAGFTLTEGHPNVVAGGKRPFHTIIPAMLAKGGRTVMPFGVMGGQYQAVGHAQMLTGILDRGFDSQGALDAPRSFAFDGVLALEATVPAAVRADLDQRGHRTVVADEPLGSGQAISIDDERGVLLGASDQRKDGMALGW